MPFIIVAMALAAVIGGGASVAAKNALPGDALWSFKTMIVEPLQADGDSDVIRKRIKEAEKLANQGRLGANARAELISHITAHTLSAEKQINNKWKNGEYTAAATLATNLQTALVQAAGILDIRALLDTASSLSEKVNATVKQ